GVKVTAEASFMGHALRPWMEAGVRQLLSDRDDGVTGAFQGVQGLSIEVDGVSRDRSVARVSTGFSYQAAPAVTFSAGYTGEFGDNARHNVGLGVALKF
ncbi:MAG: autotransporter outer membrane beta-barrel domain-containing protein, partial [Brevundimonas sp.]